MDVVGLAPAAILPVSAKTGEGVEALLDALIEAVPPPEGDADAPLSALVADSWYDPYAGVVALVRVMEGCLEKGMGVQLMASRARLQAQETGFFTPAARPAPALGPGELGYVVTGARRLDEVRVGDTMTEAARPAAAALAGFERPQPAVFCGLFPSDARDHPKLREALAKTGPQRRLALLRARKLGGTRFRVPRRLPRPPPSGDRRRPLGARV